MDKQLVVLLIEDSRSDCQTIADYIDKFDDILLVNTTDNINKAIEDVKENLPDAIILDLELHTGEGDGLTFLQNLQNLSPPKMPYILVTTNNTSEITYECAREFGADFIMSKHQIDYSPKTPVDFLRMTKKIILSKPILQNGQITDESPVLKSKRISRILNDEFCRIGLNPKNIGYNYLIDAVKLILDKPQSNICKTIAEKYDKNYTSVERAMQNAINRAWRSSDIEDLQRYYTAKVDPLKGVPTLTEFIYYYVNKLKSEY